MNLKIKLPNYKYCDGCPCLNNNPECGTSCNLNYWTNNRDVLVRTNKGKMAYFRPSRCIKENGR